MLITLKDYDPHLDTALKLPDKGLVVIQGTNGSGKSTILEAYCAALWSKSLRGASPHRGTYCIDVELPGLKVKRTKDSLTVNGESALKSSKKQPELVSLVGTWDNFTRIRCFDSELTARFGIATDAERKKLLERLCGLEAIDEGLKKCRADVRTADKKRQESLQQVELIKSGLAERAAVVAPDAAVLAELNAKAATIATMLHEMAKREGAATAEVGELDRRLTQLKADRCPLCASPITNETREKLRADLNTARSTYKDLEAQRKQNSAQGTALQADLQKLRAQAAVAAESARFAVRRDELQRQLAAANQTHSMADKQHGVLKLIEDFFVSVRPKLLTSSLASLHAAASTWLSVMTPDPFHIWLEGDDVRIRLGVRDYKELNRGHRRRLDLALMLALSQLHQATVRGPIFLDEALDGLDPDGAEAAAAVLEAVGRNELVIVLTHSEELAGRLRGVKIKVANGTCTMLRLTHV